MAAFDARDTEVLRRPPIYDRRPSNATYLHDHTETAVLRPDNRVSAFPARVRESRTLGDLGYARGEPSTRASRFPALERRPSFVPDRREETRRSMLKQTHRSGLRYTQKSDSEPDLTHSADEQSSADDLSSADEESDTEAIQERERMHKSDETTAELESSDEEPDDVDDLPSSPKPVEDDRGDIEEGRSKFRNRLKKSTGMLRKSTANSKGGKNAADASEDNRSLEPLVSPKPSEAMKSPRSNKAKDADKESSDKRVEEVTAAKKAATEAHAHARRRRGVWHRTFRMLEKYLCHFDEFIRIKIPFVRIPVFFVLIPFAVLAVVCVIMYLAAPGNSIYASIPTWMWLLMACVALAAFIVCRCVAGIVQFILNSVFGRSWLFYYLHYLTWPMTFFLWGIFVLLLRYNIPWFFDSADFSTDKDYVRLVGVLCIIVSICRIVFRTFVKATILSNLKAHFMDDLNRSLRNEAILQTIVKHAKPKKEKWRAAIDEEYGLDDHVKSLEELNNMKMGLPPDTKGGEKTRFNAMVKWVRGSKGMVFLSLSLSLTTHTPTHPHPHTRHNTAHNTHTTPHHTPTPRHT